MSSNSEKEAVAASLRRKLKAEWRTRVLQMTPKMTAIFGQTSEASFGGFPTEFQELVYADAYAMIWGFLSPFAATDNELSDIGAEITAEGAAVAFEADALLESEGFYFVRGVQRAIGGKPKDWDAFLMGARFKGYNLLGAVFLNRTKTPLTLLREAIPADEKMKEEYLLQTHKDLGGVMSTAVGGDVFNDQQWRLQSLWDLIPNWCRKMAVTPFKNHCPLHHAVLHSTVKQDLDYESFYETLLKTLPAEELGYSPETVTAFEIPLMNGAGTSSVMLWASIKTRNSQNKEIIMSALREALVL